MATSSVLFCLVVLLTFSATDLESVPSTYADPPPLVVEEVGSQGFVISWNTTGAWENVTDFDVTVTSSTSVMCDDKISCNTDDPCRFNSSIHCNGFGNCKELEIIVEGKNIPAKLNITTAPPAVNESATTLSVNGTSAILKWKNYSAAACHNFTRVLFITENSEYIYEVSSSTNEKTHNLSACDYGLVESFVQTVGGSGESAFKNRSASFSAEDAGPLFSDLTLSPGNDTLNVSWTLSTDNCPRLKEYLITWDPGNTTGVKIGAEDKQYIIEGLIPCSEYNVTLQGLEANNITLSSPSNASSSTNIIVLKPPTNLKSAYVTHDSFRLEWTPQEYGPLCPLTNYSISWASSVDYNDTGSDIIDQSSVDYTIGDLSACTTYNVVIKANNSKGFSDPAETQVKTTAITPVAPAVICFNATNATCLVVAWTKPPKTNCIHNYEVRYSGDVLWSTEVTENIEYVNRLNIILKNLTPWTSYTVCVAGCIQNGSLGDEDCCHMTTLEERPGPPASINASSSDRSIFLEWEAPSEVNGNLLGYQVSLGNNKLNLTANETSVVISELKSRSDYKFTLQARTGPGLGADITIVVSTGGSNVVAIVLGISGGLALVVIIIIAVMKRTRIARIFRREVQRVRSRRNTKRAATEMSERRTTSTTEACSPSQVTVNAIYKKDLQQYIVDLEADSQVGLEREFNELRNMSPEHSTAIAKEHYNRLKNRFISILPYDQARVILHEVPGYAGSDFIKASYIKDYYGEKSFVATQGPTNNTKADFWRMVWELNVSTIVMLTKLIEKEKDMCSEYWPDVLYGIVTTDDFQISNRNQDKGALFTTNYLEIQRAQEKRMLKHFRLTTWPEFGVPQHEYLLLDFMRKIKSLTSHNKSPMVIHCSAGEGRTGIFISLWNLMEYVKNEPQNPKINIKEVVLEMRQCRPFMVQSQDQYLYLCKCIAKYMENPIYWDKLYEDDDHIYDYATFVDDNIYGSI